MHYLLYELAKNPAVQEKLHAEVRTHLSADGHVSEEALAKLKYLKHVVKENFR